MAGVTWNVPFAAPLREVLASPRRFRVTDLPVVEGGWIAFQENGWLRVLDGRTLTPILRAGARDFSVAGVQSGRLLGWGKPPSTKAMPISVLDGQYARRRVRTDSALIGAGVDEVHCWDTETGLRTWSWFPDVGSVESGSGNTIRTDVCSDGERVYFGMRDGMIRALNLRDGKEAWRTVLVKNPDPFTDDDRAFHLWAAEPTGSGSVRDGVVYFHASNRAVALEVLTGKHIWEAKAYCTGGQLHLDSYHCLGVGGEYEILDARTGRRRFKKDLTSVTPARFHNGGMPMYQPMVVSDTHMFCGYGIGYLLAFERTTGRLVWHKRASPALSFHQENYFQIVNGRLYAGDYGTMRIYEEVNPTDPVLIRQRAEAQGARRQARVRPTSRATTPKRPKGAVKAAVSAKRIKKVTPVGGRKTGA